MYRPLIAAVWLAAILGPAQGADDPIGEKLKAAKAAHETEVTEFRKAVTALLDEREVKAREKGNKAEVDRLKAEGQAFVDKGAIPLNVPGALTSAHAASKSRMESAYTSAIKEYTKAKKDDLASKVQEEFDDWFKEMAPPKPRAVDPKKPYVVATWIHKAGKGKETGRAIKLYSNGHIDSPEGSATWTRTGSTLILRWPAPKAPGGAWEDVCEVSADGKRYSGRNEKGVQITGTKLGDGDVKVKGKD